MNTPVKPSRVLSILLISTIGLSSFLLFAVQPIVSKLLLPQFGGAAAVWTTGMLFFQTVLLLGYLYADRVTAWLTTRNVVVLHSIVALLSLLALPIGLNSIEYAGIDQSSIMDVILLFAVAVALPYFLLSTTSPLLQSFAASANLGFDPYRLFAVSNATSIAGLLIYPFFIEPFVGARSQAVSWSFAYALLVMAVVFSCVLVRKRMSYLADHAAAAPLAENISSRSNTIQYPPPLPAVLLWMFWSALGSALLLSVSNTLNENVPGAGLLWVLPLIMYLLSFVVTFGGRNRYNNRAALPWIFVAWFVLSFVSTGAMGVDRVIFLALPIFCFGLFLLCFAFHGELANSKPDVAYLPRYYLALSIGGAIGAALVAIVAPLLLNETIELSIVLLVCGVAMIFIARRIHRLLGHAMVFFALSAIVGGGVFYVIGTREDIASMRNFYAALRVQDTTIGTPSSRTLRSLVHGSTSHGSQFTRADLRAEPYSYHGRSSGLGLALAHQRTQIKANGSANSLRVATLGLGAGVAAAYCQQGDTCDFYEINPQVVKIAETYFKYLSDAVSRGAQIRHVVGDARKSLEHQTAQKYDLIAVDVFSSGMIPAHMLTIEALTEYRRHLGNNGIIALHISNAFLDLAPIVGELAGATNLVSRLYVDEVREGDNPAKSASHWIILSPSFENLPESATSVRVKRSADTPLWTDDRHSVFSALAGWQRFREKTKVTHEK